MAQGCIFCKIARKEVPADLVYEDQDVVAFRDINPQAPTHILIIPRAHLGNVASLESGTEIGHMVLVAARIAREQGIEESGYRLVLNAGPQAGESVPHLHLHLMGGRQMAWPPG